MLFAVGKMPGRATPYVGSRHRGTSGCVAESENGRRVLRPQGARVWASSEEAVADWGVRKSSGRVDDDALPATRHQATSEDSRSAQRLAHLHCASTRSRVLQEWSRARRRQRNCRAVDRFQRCRPQESAALSNVSQRLHQTVESQSSWLRSGRLTRKAASEGRSRRTRLQASSSETLGNREQSRPALIHVTRV